MFDIFISQLEIMKMRIIHFDKFLINRTLIHFLLVNAIYLGISIYTISTFCIFVAEENHNYLTRNILQRQATLLFCSAGNSS